MHVDREVADALVLRCIGVAAGDQHAEVREVTGRRPDLLAVDDPFVPVLLGPGLQPGEVGTGDGLAEQLAPRTAPGDDVPDVVVDLLLRTVHGDRRGCEQQAQTAGCRQRAVFGDRLRDTVRVGAGETFAEGVLRQRRCRPPRQAETLPPVGDGEVGVPVVVEPDPQFVEHLGHGSMVAEHALTRRGRIGT